MGEPRTRGPSKKAVRRHWAQTLVEFDKADSLVEALEPGLCFACGFAPEVWKDSEADLERAHIKAHRDGGPNTVDNLHLLCPTCHKASEFMDGEAYWEWFRTRTAVDMMLQRAAARGLNLSVLLSAGTPFAVRCTEAHRASL